MTIGIDGITDLGNIFQEDITVNNRLISLPLPASSTSITVNINLFGKTRNIVITGSHSGQGYGGGQTGIKAFIDQIEDWVDASIQGGKTYTDSFGETYNVLSSVWKWTKEVPGNRILYVITMLEGITLSSSSP